jgi:hypothetical protein
MLRVFAQDFMEKLVSPRGILGIAGLLGRAKKLDRMLTPQLAEPAMPLLDCLGGSSFWRGWVGRGREKKILPTGRAGNVPTPRDFSLLGKAQLAAFVGEGSEAGVNGIGRQQA